MNKKEINEIKEKVSNSISQAIDEVYEKAEGKPFSLEIKMSAYFDETEEPSNYDECTEDCCKCDCCNERDSSTEDMATYGLNKINSFLEDIARRLSKLENKECDCHTKKQNDNSFNYTAWKEALTAPDEESKEEPKINFANAYKYNIDEMLARMENDEHVKFKIDSEFLHRNRNTIYRKVKGILNINMEKLISFLENMEISKHTLSSFEYVVLTHGSLILKGLTLKEDMLSDEELRSMLRISLDVRKFRFIKV